MNDMKREGERESQREKKKENGRTRIIYYE